VFPEDAEQMFLWRACMDEHEGARW